MVVGREDVPSTLKLRMIFYENENQFLIFLIVIYLINPNIPQFQLVENTVNELYRIFLTCRSFRNQSTVCLRSFELPVK